MGPPSLPAATPCMTESFDQQKLALFEESKAGASFSLHQTSSNLRACSELNGKVSGLTKLQPVLRTLYIYSILTLINLPLYTRLLRSQQLAAIVKGGARHFFVTTLQWDFTLSQGCPKFIHCHKIYRFKGDCRKTGGPRLTA
eukprot:scaffold15809_cov18-Tisochrysis_lutea.AAC.2